MLVTFEIGVDPAVVYLVAFMKLTWVLVVILSMAIGMAARYKLARAREHQHLEQNKPLVRLVYPFFSAEDKEARYKMAHQIYADKFIVHDWEGDRTTGPDGMADGATLTHIDYSGWSEHPEMIVAEGDYVAVRSWAGGKQAKDFDAIPHLSPAIPNKGRSLSMQESILFRVADGKIAEEWALLDGWDYSVQLGLVDNDHFRESICGPETKR